MIAFISPTRLETNASAWAFDAAETDPVTITAEQNAPKNMRRLNSLFVAI
jgi:hypothetical protein